MLKKAATVPPDLIAKVKRNFKVRTETEAIVLALREMTFMDEMGRALRASSGKSSASQATAATNSTQTPMNTKQRNTSSIWMEVANPDARAPKA